MWAVVYKQLGGSCFSGSSERGGIYFHHICYFPSESLRPDWDGGSHLCWNLRNMCHSGLTRQDTDQGPHVFYRCKNFPKPSNQERNKIQITLIFLFSQGFYYLYRQNGKEVSVVNSLLLYITLCHLTFECQIGLLTQAK